ncbi:MAG: hypothetical protein KAQ75_07795 [Bacteroidales bacterium]|nr:hypothetical protein [Bacteroidales bacterium]
MPIKEMATTYQKHFRENLTNTSKRMEYRKDGAISLAKKVFMLRKITTATHRHRRFANKWELETQLDTEPGKIDRINYLLDPTNFTKLNG